MKGRRILPLLLLLVMSLTLFVYQPVHAAGPTVQHNGNNNCANINTCAVSVTVGTVGNVIIIAIAETTSAGTVIGVASTMTDSFGDTFSAKSTQVGNVYSSGNRCDNPNFCFAVEIWTAIAVSTGVDSVTVTFSGTPGLQTEMLGALDVSGIGPTPSPVAIGGCTIPACVGGTAMTTTSSPSFTFGSLAVEDGALISGTITDGTNMTNFAGQANSGSAGYSTTLSSPSNFPMTKSAGGGVTYWVETGVIFASAASVSTTTINTMCLGACTGGQNGTGNYLIRNLLYFYQSQNVNNIGTIDNVTLKIGAVHMNVTQGNLYVAIYTGNTLPPNGGNPYHNIPGPTGNIVVPIFNNTANFFVHLNPQSVIPALTYYAVAIMAAPEGHSRGSGAANSGVQVMETSISGITEYNYAPAGPSGSAQTPPGSFYSAVIQTPRHFIFIHTLFPVYLITTTTTSTLTVGGTATTTATVTSTNIINQLNMSSAGFWFIPLLFLLAPMAVLITVKRFATGG